MQSIDIASQQKQKIKKLNDQDANNKSDYSPPVTISNLNFLFLFLLFLVIAIIL